MGCVEQYQFCNHERCTPLCCLYAINEGAAQVLGFNSNQAAAFQLLLKTARNTRTELLLIFLGNEILFASEKLFGALWLSSALEDNQWQMEMENIHNISMALLQMGVVEHAFPLNFQARRSINRSQYIIKENNTEALRLCANQKIRSTTHSSFNMLGICLIFLGGSFFIIVKISLPSLVGRVQRQTEKGLAARLAWIENDILQIQRIAYEGRGIGPWNGQKERVPVTVQFGQTF
jgi:hypothetical protein